MATENAAQIGRVTAGWKRPELSLDFVRPYWRDAHSPAIARRAGVYEYRHYPLDPVRPDLAPGLSGVEREPPPHQQLMWLSDVRYRDQAGLDAFGESPPPGVKAKILADIEMIVHQSTTYLVLGDNAHTAKDVTGDPAPQGPAVHPTFAIFLRQRGETAAFQSCIKRLTEHWATLDGVLRVRRSLFEVPDMEAERRAGYPVKTHPLDLQYQAWIDIVVKSEAVMHQLYDPAIAGEHAAAFRAIHTYPAPAIYTFNCAGAPTLSGLRGYPAAAAIRSLGAAHQLDADLLHWMYGDAARAGPAI